MDRRYRDVAYFQRAVVGSGECFGMKDEFVLGGEIFFREGWRYFFVLFVVIDISLNNTELYLVCKASHIDGDILVSELIELPVMVRVSVCE